MAKRILIATGLAAILGLVGMSYSGFAAQSQSKPTPKPQKTLSDTFKLTQFDQDLIMSMVTQLPGFALEDKIEALKIAWTPAYIAPSLEIYGFTPNVEIRETIISLLKTSTGQDFGTDINAWYRWLWNEPEIKVEGYADFKATLYENIDPRFVKYFKDRQSTTRIRLDEVRWGGVRQDGIPPLRQPKMISAKKAKYLDDGDVVFGIEVNGDVRAYPKRILAWHEMFVDEIGDVELAGVYCTLCGTVIPYVVDGHNLGTSGFLYRSNKLMYDKSTQSLWNTIKGEPVLGPLVDKDIALEHLSVVTTTWGEWRKRHPKTKVLSLDTGHNRDYGEGVAYHQYFSTDNLMFNTPFQDSRLKNKDEVLALRFKKYPWDQLAISADFLDDNPIYTNTVGKQDVLILTDKTGGNRVYDPKGVKFAKYDRDNTLTDTDGTTWTLEESKLVSDDGQVLNRLPYHRAFWFGWHATYPDSRLVK